MLLLWRVSQWEEDHAYESPMQRLCTTARSGWDLLAVVASLLTQLTVTLDSSPSTRHSLSVLRSADFQGASLPCRVCFSDFVVAVVFRCTAVVVSAVWRIVPCVFLSLASRLLGRGSIGPSSNLCLWNGARFVRCAVPGVNKQRKAAHSDAVPFFGPRHFPFLCIGVVSTLPTPTRQCVLFQTQP